MKTFIITSYTNYGKIIHIVNAKDEQEAMKNTTAWDGFDIEELDTTKEGEVFVDGGEG